MSTIKVTQVEDAPNQEFKKALFPTEIVELPSKGVLYPEGHPLRDGKVEIKYMTAKEEDILSTESYIKSGVVIDKLLQSLIVSPKFDYNDLIIGDKNAIMFAARAYGYGENYEFTVTAPSGNKQTASINLHEIKHKELPENLTVNDFVFTLPKSKQVINFKVLTVKDDQEIESALKKTRPAGSRDPRLTLTMGKMITAVDGVTEPGVIKGAVENMLVSDGRALREYASSVQPNINLEIDCVDEVTGETFQSSIALGPKFFWPDARV